MNDDVAIRLKGSIIYIAYKRHKELDGRLEALRVQKVTMWWCGGTSYLHFTRKIHTSTPPQHPLSLNV